ncbi:hypothetical protein [Kitasatospora sp. NPDC001132]
MEPTEADPETDPETAHIRDLVTESVTGYEPVGFADHCWVLHALRELDDAGREIRRTRWAQPLAGAGRHLGSWGFTPSTRVFDGIPLQGLTPPDSGAPDRGSLRALVEVLARFSPDGPDTECYWAQPPLENIGEPVKLRRGRLREALALWDGLGSPGFPNAFPVNWWPVDRSWFVYSDNDLSATEVFGSAELVAAVLATASLDAVRHPLVAEVLDSRPGWLV